MEEERQRVDCVAQREESLRIESLGAKISNGPLAIRRRDRNRRGRRCRYRDCKGKTREKRVEAERPERRL